MSAILNDIYTGLVNDKGRLFLSIGAISIGMLTLIILICSLQGLKEQSDRQIRTLGIHTFAIIDEANQSADSIASLSNDTLSLLTRHIPEADFAPTRHTKAQALGSVESVNVIATNSALANIRNWQVTQGRFFSPHDLQQRSRVAVVDRILASEWGWMPGAVIMLGQVTFRVIGVIDTQFISHNELSDKRHLINGRSVFVPHTLDSYWQAGYQNDTSTFDAIYVKAKTDQTFWRNLNLSQRLLGSSDDLQLAWITPQDLVKRITALRHTMQLTLGGVSALSVIMGCITLVALMSANVRQRKSEIGLRRALGATRFDIQQLFVLEALLITGAPFIAGSALAAILLQYGQSYFPFPIKLQQSFLIWPLAISLGAGVIACLWPARLAANIQPAVALRQQ